MKIENLERINELIQERRNVEEHLDILKAIKGKLVTSDKDGYDFNVTIDERFGYDMPVNHKVSIDMRNFDTMNVVKGIIEVYKEKLKYIDEELSIL